MYMSFKLDKHLHELRRGSLVLAVLLVLKQTAYYGYQLRQHLANHDLMIDEGTLYPLLRRLESQGLLESHWQVGSGESRQRRYYQCTQLGIELTRVLANEWHELHLSIQRLEENNAI